MKALSSIRQPHAEAIMRGVKPIEYRSTSSTNVRGKVYIYASLGRYTPEEEAEMMRMLRHTTWQCDDLPVASLIGTVDLGTARATKGTTTGMFAIPERATELVKPTKHPQPIWFNPF